MVTVIALRLLGLFPTNTDKIATIADVVGTRLCGRTTPYMHPTNAASLGFFTRTTGRFDVKALEALDIPQILIPELAVDAVPLGGMNDVTVSPALGDTQAGVLGAVWDDGVLLNVGTSGQISVVTAGEERQSTSDPEIRPYVAGKTLYCGSMLCGGRAIAMLADLVTEIAQAFGA